ncbi:MAG: RecX family transcriptional regulator [Acidobacteria bacterium]|nr:RecX family transcriptional regulator [Acidobacteriota bacterium]
MGANINKMLLRRAGSFLARRAYSRNDLRKKLEGLAGDSEIKSVLNHLEQLNLLNDDDYAYNFALQRIRQQGWSPLKIQNALLRHEVGLPAIDRALELIRNEAGDQSALILEYIQNHFGKKGMPRDPKGVRKLILHLGRRGFDDESILGALRQILPAAALQPFETGD